MNMKLVKTIVGERPAEPSPERPTGTHIVEVDGRFWLVDMSRRVGYLIGGKITDHWKFGAVCPWTRMEFGRDEKLLDRPITIHLEPVQ